MNIYGESPWSSEFPVQTTEAIITSEGRMIRVKFAPQSIALILDLDLPQLHVVSYNLKENLLHFDYLPGDDRWTKLNNDQLCLHIRQSSDGVIYQSIDQCLAIQNNRVHWTISKDLPYLKLSICAKKHRHICGQEIEMKEGRAMQGR